MRTIESTDRLGTKEGIAKPPKSLSLPSQAEVDGTAFSPPPMTPAKKCDVKYCAFGATCKYDAEKDEAKCLCK